MVANGCSRTGNLTCCWKWFDWWIRNICCFVRCSFGHPLSLSQVAQGVSAEPRPSSAECFMDQTAGSKLGSFESSFLRSVWIGIFCWKEKAGLPASVFAHQAYHRNSHQAPMYAHPSPETNLGRVISSAIFAQSMLFAIQRVSRGLCPSSLNWICCESTQRKRRTQEEGLQSSVY